MSAKTPLPPRAKKSGTAVLTTPQERPEISIALCRQLLGPEAVGKSDSEIMNVRSQLYALARIVTSVAVGLRDCGNVIDSLPRDEREDVEERAAILEFDGKLSRNWAERVALSKHRPVR